MSEQVLVTSKIVMEAFEPPLAPPGVLGVWHGRDLLVAHSLVDTLSCQSQREGSVGKSQPEWEERVTSGMVVDWEGFQKEGV